MATGPCTEAFVAIACCKMSFQLPVLCNLKPSLQSYTVGLPEFQWADLCDKEEIGCGTYGTVLLVNSQTTSEKVVVKKLIVS